MAKGYDDNRARLEQLSLLGKDLARRSKSKCELSGESGVPLRVYEVAPAASEPELSKCLLLSEAVYQQIHNPRSIVASVWRGVLAELIWSEFTAQQVMAHRLLTLIAFKEPWAQEILAEAFLEDEVTRWSESAPLAG